MFNLFYEWAARYVHLSTQEAERTSSFCGYSTYMTSTNLQKMQTVNERKWCYSQSKVISGRSYCQTFKGIQNNFQQNSIFFSYPVLMIFQLSPDVFPKTFNIYFHEIKIFLKSLCLRNTGQLFRKIITYKQYI